MQDKKQESDSHELLMNYSSITSILLPYALSINTSQLLYMSHRRKENIFPTLQMGDKQKGRNLPTIT